MAHALYSVTNNPCPKLNFNVVERLFFFSVLRNIMYVSVSHISCCHFFHTCICNILFFFVKQLPFNPDFKYHFRTFYINLTHIHSISVNYTDTSNQINQTKLHDHTIPYHTTYTTVEMFGKKNTRLNEKKNHHSEIVIWRWYA